MEVGGKIVQGNVQPLSIYIISIFFFFSASPQFQDHNETSCEYCTEYYVTSNGFIHFFRGMDIVILIICLPIIRIHGDNTQQGIIQHHDGCVADKQLFVDNSRGVERM